MSTLILYGVAFSTVAFGTYVRTACMACVEKGVGYTLAHDSVDEVCAKAHLALHPFGKMPAMRHGDFVLHGTSAICRYINAAAAIRDLVLASILAYPVKTPEGEALMGRYANGKRALQVMRQRRSFCETAPPPPPGA